jgi:hypothetical protein
MAINWGHIKAVKVEEKRLAVIKKDIYDKPE